MHGKTPMESWTKHPSRILHNTHPMGDNVKLKKVMECLAAHNSLDVTYGRLRSTLTGTSTGATTHAHIAAWCSVPPRNENST